MDLNRDRPWDEQELSFAQRRLVKSAHRRIRLYDLGWRRNLQQILGLNVLIQRHQSGSSGSASKSTHTRSRDRSRDRSGASEHGRVGLVTYLKVWSEILAFGGSPRGNGKQFPRNPKAKGMLEKLAEGLDAMRARENGRSDVVFDSGIDSDDI